MAKRTDSTAPPRRPLNRERVLRAAINLADTEGIEALSMRRLAKELGVEAMSLYNHVANKDEILDGIIDAIVDEIDHPTDAADWTAAMRQCAISTRDVLVRHRWASGLWMSRQGIGDARLRHGDWLLRTLREGGLSSDLIYQAYHVLEAYLLGFMVLHQSVPAKEEDLAGMAATFMQQIRPEEYPDLVEHIREHAEPREGRSGGFELGLDLILEGLDRARALAGDA
jgi:AcrR family transcriptional regulator